MTRFQANPRIASTIIVLVSYFVAPCQIHSQDLKTTLPRQIANTLSLSPPQGSKLLPLDQPISLGSISIKDSSDKTNMSLWTVPALNQKELVTLGSTPISEVVQSFFSTAQSFELGYATLSTEQQERLKKAQEVLYSDSEATTPSKKLARFRKWKSDRGKLLEEIQVAANNVSKQLSLNQSLQTLDQDYRLLGEKEQVETALEIIDRSTSQAPLFQSQLEQLKTRTSVDVQSASSKRFFDTISSSSGWVRVTFDAKALKDSVATEAILGGQGGQGKKFPLTLKSVSFQVLLARTDQPPLSADIFSNRAWRRRDKQVLSQGNADIDSKEVLPRYISDALIIRDVDMHFESTPEFTEFGVASQTSNSGTIGGIPLRLSGAGSSYSIIDHVYLPSPIVVAVIVARTQKAPNQASDLMWK